MSRPEAFDRVLVSLHEAALDDARWPAAAAQIDRLCGSKGSVLVYGDDDGASPDDVQIYLASACFGGQPHEQCVREYFETYHNFDERLARLRRLRDARVVPVAWLLSEAQMKTSLVYNEMLLPGDLGNALHARLDGPDGTRIVWTSADPVDPAGWSSGPVEMLERILSHLRHYIRVRHALVSARALAASFSDLVENVNLAVIHLDRRGHVVSANERAQDLLRKGDGLSCRDGALHAGLCEEDDKLQKVIARAMFSDGAARAGGSVVLTREHSVTRLVLHITPVAAGGVGESGGRLRALVLLVDPDARSRLDPDRLRELLGLTPAEAQIASMLVEGRTMREIAGVTGRSPITVKWHVQHLFNRVGVRRQTDLVRVLLSLGDVAGA